MSESLRPSSQPHPSATLLGDGGDYYIPGQASREPGVVLAAWFFLATETEAPEVRESLHSDVFPLVPRCQPYFQAWRNRKGVYDLYADDWVAPEWATVKGDDSSDAAAHRSIFDHRRLLAPGGVYAMVGGGMGSLLRAPSLRAAAVEGRAPENGHPRHPAREGGPGDGGRPRRAGRPALCHRSPLRPGRGADTGRGDRAARV